MRVYNVYDDIIIYIVCTCKYIEGLFGLICTRGGAGLYYFIFHWRCSDRGVNLFRALYTRFNKFRYQAFVTKENVVHIIYCKVIEVF